MMLPLEQDEQVYLHKRDLVGDVEEHFKELSEMLNLKSSYRQFKKQFWKDHKNSSQVTKLKMNLHTKNFNNEAEISQFSKDYKATFDYIFFSADGTISPSGILLTPELEML